MLLIITLVIFVFAVLSGVGLLFLLKLPADSSGLHRALDAFWCGWALVVGLLQVWHFFFPVNLPAGIIVLTLGVAGWALEARRRQVGVRQFPWLAAAGLLFPVFWMANHVLYAQPGYDHGLYHLQTVKWFNQFALVPGLGNLHHRLAFNSAQYLYAALLNVGPLHGFNYYVANTVLLGALAGQSLLGLTRWLSNNRRGAQADLFYALMLPAILWHASTQNLAGYSADMAIFAVQVVLTGWLVRSVFQEIDGEESGRLLPIVLLACAGMAVKLSFWVFGALTLIYTWIMWRGRRLPHQPRRAPVPLGWVGCVAGFLLPWIARNAMLSGYLFYPSPILPVNVPWKMPVYLIRDISLGITQWARSYSGQLPYTADLAWFLDWLRKFDFEPRLAFMATLALLVGIGLVTVTRRQAIAPRLDYGWLLAGLGVSVVAWFISAPVYRFSGAILWLGLALTLMWGYEWIEQAYSGQVARTAMVTAILVVLMVCPPAFSKNLSLSTLIHPRTEQAIAQEAQPSANLVGRVTESGSIVYTPTGALDELCWDAPLPCTTARDFLPNLQWIDPQGLQKGFYLINRP